MTQKIDATCFHRMIHGGARLLQQNEEQVNALNVFPVPDGDTGTNMNLTLSSGVREMDKVSSSTRVGDLAEALSKGLLMGARGNSGVILSQLFRGFAKAVSEKETIDARDLAEAFKKGVDMAYKAVMKPVEGTILTVSREAADRGMIRSRQTDDPAEVMAEVLSGAQQSLEKTPQLLPILAETNVVDAGGQGLVYILEGFLAALRGEGIWKRRAVICPLPKRNVPWLRLPTGRRPSPELIRLPSSMDIVRSSSSACRAVGPLMKGISGKKWAPLVIPCW